jgi:hypothetical protein
MSDLLSSKKIGVTMGCVGYRAMGGMPFEPFPYCYYWSANAGWAACPAIAKAPADWGRVGERTGKFRGGGIEMIPEDEEPTPTIPPPPAGIEATPAK